MSTSEHQTFPSGRCRIIESAERNGCDLIVIASHGHRGMDRMLLGSQTAEVLGFSKLPVLVLR